MKVPRHTLLLALIPALAVFSPAQDAGDTGAQAPGDDGTGLQPPSFEPEVDDGQSMFGAPLYVNGKRISDLAIKRFLCYGKGRNALEARKLAVLMQQEWELRAFMKEEELLADAYSGRTREELSEEELAAVTKAIEEELSRFEIDMEDYEALRLSEAASFTERYPTLDLDTEIERAYASVQWYRDQLLQTMQFDRMFFPDHPDTWPEISIEAIHAGSAEVDLVADYAKHYEIRRLKAEEEGETKVPAEDEMMMGLLRDYVMGALASLVDIRSAMHGLPQDILMTVDGGGFYHELKTDDVYEEMKASFTEKDIADAKRFLAMIQATRDLLEAEEGLMRYQDFVDMFVQMEGDLAGGMFNMDFLALQGHQFPSQEAYQDHLYLLESYRRFIESELESGEVGVVTPELDAHLPVANGIMGLAKARAEILLVAAFDFPKYEWKEDGWAWAEKESLRLRAEVDAYLDRVDRERAARQAAAAAGEVYEPDEEFLPFDRWWGNVLDQTSEYWDPPMPATGKNPPAIGMKNKGRFNGQPMTRNDLKRAMGESSYYHWLSGTSIVDTIFFDLQPGEVGGPFEGPYGYYIVYLRSRSAPTNPLNVRNEKHVSMLKEDYVRARFTEYAQKALADADVKGL